MNETSSSYSEECSAKSHIDKVPYKLTDSTISTGCMNAANTIPLWIEPKKGAHKKKKSILHDILTIH